MHHDHHDYFLNLCLTGGTVFADMVANGLPTIVSLLGLMCLVINTGCSLVATVERLWRGARK